jgi:hypothetical protein
MKCQNMSENVKIGQKLLEFIEIYHNLSQTVKVYHNSRICWSVVTAVNSNKITSFEAKAFSNLKELVELNLSYNLIEGEVEKELFLNLNNLKWLILNNNKITKLNDCLLNKPTELVVLNVQTNK